MKKTTAIILIITGLAIILLITGPLSIGFSVWQLPDRTTITPTLIQKQNKYTPFQILNACGNTAYGGRCQETLDCFTNPPKNFAGGVDLTQQTSIPKMTCCQKDNTCGWQPLEAIVTT